jgi:hypothetical protein
MTEEQKILETLDRIVAKSNDIDGKLQKILDMINKPRIRTIENDGPIMFRHKRINIDSDILNNAEGEEDNF